MVSGTISRAASAARNRSMTSAVVVQVGARGSAKLAHGDFFRRISQLRLSILPQGYKNCVTPVNEVIGSATTEAEKFCALAKVGSSVPEIVHSASEDLPEKKFAMT